MESKIIYFRKCTGSGALACADGEIESVSNIRMVTADPTLPPDAYTSEDFGDDTPPDAPPPGLIINPDDILQPINELSSQLLPLVEFQLIPAVVPGWHNHPDNPPSKTVEAPKSKDAYGWASRASEVLAKFHKEASRANLFSEPFLIISALRLNDGSNLLPSSPVLLTPSTEAPFVESADDFSVDAMTMTVNGKAARLRYHITAPEQLTDFAQRNIPFPLTASTIEAAQSAAIESSIVAIDIFISSPLPLYDHDESLLPYHRAPGSTLPQSYLTTPFTDGEFTDLLLSTSTFRRISSIPISAIGQKEAFFDVEFNVPQLSGNTSSALYTSGNAPSSISTPAKTIPTLYTPDFFQHHGIAAQNGCQFSGRITLCDLTLTLPLPPHPASLFPFSAPSSDLQENQNEGSVSSSSTPLSDFQEKQNESSVSSSSTPLSDFQEKQSEGSVFPEAKEAEREAMGAEVITGMEVMSIKNGETLYASRRNLSEPSVALTETDFPHWLFIPDADARQLNIVTNQAIYIVPLMRHPLLNGAFFWSGSIKPSSFAELGITKIPNPIPYSEGTTSSEESPSSEETSSSDMLRDTFHLPDYILRSGKNNPLHFPQQLLMKTDTGRVNAICRAFRASGLVATTAPTAYLFTISGIYLLKEMDDGTLRDAGLIAGHVLGSPSSLAMSGRSLYLDSVSGERLVISGTGVKLLNSASLNSTSTTSKASSGKIILTPENPDIPVEIITRPLKLLNLLPMSDALPYSDSLPSPDSLPISDPLTMPAYLHASTSKASADRYPTLSDYPSLTPFATLSCLERRMCAVSLIGSFSGSPLLTIYGSPNLTEWQPIAAGSGKTLKFLRYPLLRYARLKISGEFSGSVEAIAFIR